MFRWTSFLAIAFLCLVTYADAQPKPGGIIFGRVPGVGSDGRRLAGSAYRGRADRSNETGGATRYQGNVYIFFEDAKIVVLADEVTENGNELTLRGNVRLKLDGVTGTATR
jgi:hypothetical protein